MRISHPVQFNKRPVNMKEHCLILAVFSFSWTFVVAKKVQYQRLTVLGPFSKNVFSTFPATPIGCAARCSEDITCSFIQHSNGSCSLAKIEIVSDLQLGFDALYEISPGNI